jgi:hypothetical protein
MKSDYILSPQYDDSINWIYDISTTSTNVKDYTTVTITPVIPETVFLANFTVNENGELVYIWGNND